MHHSPILHFVGKVSWIITALFSIHIGLMQLGVNLLKHESLMRFMPYIHYTVGVAGLVSLVMLVMACIKKCNCGKADCKCCYFSFPYDFL